MNISTADAAGMDGLWDDIQAQGESLLADAKAALTPDNWTTATRIIPWAIGGLLILYAMRSGSRR